MPESSTEIGRFGFGIRIIRHEDGRVEYQTESANQGVPTEIIIMQIKAFLKNLEDEYFDSFNKNSFKVSHGDE